MSYENIIVEIGDDYVGVITLNRPKNLNTFTIPLANELVRAFYELDSDRRVRVIILKGAGRAFSAGIDISDCTNKTVMEYKDWIECMQNPLIAVSRISKPVIAQVHGFAAANGAGMVAAADLATAAENARLGLVGINVGLSCIGPVIALSRSVGRKRALEMLFGGELISAQEALNIGMINRIFPEDELEKETRNWAIKLAQKSPLALQTAKKAFYTGVELDYHKAFEFMNEAFARLCSTEDTKEGINAFLEKRPPVWKEK